MVQQRQRKERQTQGQRKAQQRQRLRELHEQLQLQQLQRTRKQIQSATGWTRKSFQRTTRIWQRKRIQQQRKRQRVLQQPTRRKRINRKACNTCLLQMWASRTHGQAMQSWAYNCDTGNVDTNDQTDDWYGQTHYDDNWYHQDQTDRLVSPQPPQQASSSAASISRLQEVTVAMTGAAQQHTKDNKWVNLMVDSSAATHATHVCPQQRTTISTTPARTWNKTTAQNSYKSAHQALWIQMGLRDKPQRTTDCHTILCL